MEQPRSAGGRRYPAGMSARSAARELECQSSIPTGTHSSRYPFPPHLGTQLCCRQAVSTLLVTACGAREMRYRYLFLFAVVCLPAGAQPLASLVDEALHNNREILAAQKRYEAARQRPARPPACPIRRSRWATPRTAAPGRSRESAAQATSNAGIMLSQEMPFPGKRQLRGEIAAKEADAEFEEYRAVRLSVVSRLKQAYHELHHANVAIEFVEPLPGPAAEHPADLRGALLGGPRGAAGHLQGADPVLDLPDAAAAVRAGAAHQGDRDQRAAEPAAGRTHRGAEGDDAGRDAGDARGRCWRRRARNRR